MCGIAGAMIFDAGRFDLSEAYLVRMRDTMVHRGPDGGGLWLSEGLATFGLVVLIFALVRAGRAALAPFAVGAYITAAYWWSSSTSFANPMIDLARTLSDTFAGIAPASVPMTAIVVVFICPSSPLTDIAVSRSAPGALRRSAAGKHPGNAPDGASPDGHRKPSGCHRLRRRQPCRPSLPGR